MTAPVPFEHLLALTDRLGTFEHADHARPRREHGFCTDDMARVLVVVAREVDPSQAIRQLGRLAFGFLADAQGVTGKVRNRRSARGVWRDVRGVDDCWGRSLWAFGTAHRRGSDEWMRQSSLTYFERGASQRSRAPRAMSFASLGAAEVLAVDPQNRRARGVLVDAVTTIGPIGADPTWPWPEPRLTYANAVLAEALIAAGGLLCDDRALADGLVLLRWLLARETDAAHLSVTPAGGTSERDTCPRFDQQPIEAAAMADACVRAAAVTGDQDWAAGVDLAYRWFLGDNDLGLPMIDPATGGCYDGLQADRVNLNQGAESTLALISTLQHARCLVSSRE